MPIYDRAVRDLFREFVSAHGLVKGRPFARNEAISWFNQKYPKIKKGTITAHLLMLSTNAPSRIHYHPRPNGQDDLFFQTDPSHFRLYEPGVDPAPIQKGDDKHPYSANADADDNAEDFTGTKEFAYENDLKNYLSKNLTND